jgi:gas vesicle protein
MTSNAYIATDGEKFLKVGKANDVKRREKQIALPMTVTVICLDEAAAYRVESKLRNFVIKRGGIRHAATIDWFAFDPQIYKMLCEFASNIDGFEPVPVKVETEADIDAEIAKLRKRYFKLLEDELQQQLDEVRAEKAELEERNRQLQERIETLQRAIYMPYMPIKEIDEQNHDKYSDVMNALKEKDEAIMQAVQQADDEYMHVLYRSSNEITDTLKDISKQTETYLNNFRDYIAPLHEEIGALKAELRFLQEQYGGE